MAPVKASPEVWRVYSTEDNAYNLATLRENELIHERHFRTLTDCFAASCGFAEVLKDKSAYGPISVARLKEGAGKTRREAVTMAKGKLNKFGFTDDDLLFLTPEGDKKTDLNNAVHSVNSLALAFSMRRLQRDLRKIGACNNASALDKIFLLLLDKTIDQIIESEKDDVVITSQGTRPRLSVAEKYTTMLPVNSATTANEVQHPASEPSISKPNKRILSDSEDLNDYAFIDWLPKRRRRNKGGRSTIQPVIDTEEHTIHKDGPLAPKSVVPSPANSSDPTIALVEYDSD